MDEKNQLIEGGFCKEDRMAKQTSTNPDAGKTAEQKFSERSKRLQDAMQLKQPDRIPIQLVMSYMLAEMYGVTRQEQHENAERELEMLEKAGLHFQPDCIAGVYNNPGPSKAVGDRMTKFPGYGLGPNGSFQFVEGEYMKGEDYDAFIDDPADWSIRKYWPRVFSELEGLALLPPLGTAAFGTYSLTNLAGFKAPPVAKALRALAQAIEAQAEAQERIVRTTQRLKDLGFAPVPFGGVALEAPFDLISDTLRGMKGSMMDMYRRPRKLLAAQEKVLRFQLEYAVGWSRATGINIAFIPLHRGSDGFMSLPQFEEFYWPLFKALIEGLVEADIMPFVFYEGIWDQRLEHLAQLPKGETVGWFQASDIFKTKEIVGDTMCIVGGMRNSFLKAGTPEEVREWTIQLCKEVGKGGGFIMSTGVGEMEGSKPELVRVWVDTTREFGVYA
jgi:uroporphyrinogen-III decarboxylase